MSQTCDILLSRRPSHHVHKHQIQAETAPHEPQTGIYLEIRSYAPMSVKPHR